MRTIYFYGALEERYGPSLQFEVDTVQEFVRAMQANFGDFYEQIREGYYDIIRGETKESDDYIQEDRLTFSLGSADLHVVPVLAGAGNNKGLFMAIIGVALIATGVGAALTPALAGASGTAGASGAAAGFGGSFFGGSLGSFLTFGRIASFGFSLLLGGISSMLAPKIKAPGAQAPVDKAESFGFQGAINNAAQGGPVPIVYGRMLVGSTVISGGMDTENVSPGAVGVTILSNPTPRTQSNYNIKVLRDGDPINRRGT